MTDLLPQSGFNYPARQQQAIDALRRSGIDSLLLCPGADLLYLTGFEHGHAGERLLSLILHADGSGVWIVPTMNRAQLEPHVLPGQTIAAWTDTQTYVPSLKSALVNAYSVAFDGEARSAFLMDLLQHAPGVTCSNAVGIVGPLRIHKTPDEIATLLAAGRTVDETISEAISFCIPGRTEAEVDERLRSALLRRSPESEIAFTILAGGPNGALPHHETGRRALQEGDVVVLDYGTRLRGYNSDITVTCSVGHPADPDVQRVYRAVWEAQQRAIESVRPGVSCQDIDRAARRQIEAAGYGDRFLHRTGHGLGLQLHEPPYIVEGNQTPLEEGMVFSIEPGIYLSGRFGVRLEVIVTVTADGVRLLNAPSAPNIPTSSA